MVVADRAAGATSGMVSAGPAVPSPQVHPSQLRSHRVALGGTVVFVVCLCIRLALIGGVPYGDEGHYAAAAYLIFHGYTDGLFAAGSVIPPYGSLELYALLLSWLYFIPAEPLFLFRLADAACASFAGLMMFRYLYQAVGDGWAALIASVLVAMAMNDPDFVQSGGRNPIAAATLCFFSAAFLLDRRDGKSVLLPGSIMGLAVLLREPFVILAGVWILYAWYRYGIRLAARLATVLVASIALGFLVVAVLKGGIGGAHAIVYAYQNTPATDPDFNRTFAYRLAKTGEMAREIAMRLAFCMPALLLGLISPAFASARARKGFASLYLFGVGLMLAATVEALVKPPYSYHLAQALIGASILMALGLSSLIRQLSTRWLSGLSVRRVIGVVLVFGHVVLLMDYGRAMRYAAEWSLHYAPVMVLGDWTSPVVEEAYFLKIASFVRSRTKPDDRLLSTKFGIYPLTGRLPATHQTANLFNYLLSRKTDRFDPVTLDAIVAAKPRMFIRENTAVPALQERLDTLSSQIDDLFNSTSKIGPGLSPYRGVTAIVRERVAP